MSLPPNPNLHVVILCQGQQTRLHDLPRPKHMLMLPACNYTLIIERTLCQLAMLGVQYATVVCEGALQRWVDGLAQQEVDGHGPLAALRYHPVVLSHRLIDPGNSSLKGVVAYMNAVCANWIRFGPNKHTTVLLGDVVYSWRCLRTLLFSATEAPNSWRQDGAVFVGSGDLSASGGEIWGISFNEAGRPNMTAALAGALERHPPFATYQCGQLRRWFIERALMAGLINDRSDYATAKTTTLYAAVDDYTDDIDVPQDLITLPNLARQAALDDFAHGLRWNQEIPR